jgi:uncharacterized protein YbcV (DUF1398 family)
MDEGLTRIARECLEGSYAGTLDFPGVVGRLMSAGFEGYTVDYRAGIATYYLPGAEHTTVPQQGRHGSIASAFDAATVAEAVREAQTKAPGFTYARFCEKVVAAGCAGYIVSFPGRRVVYFGRTAEMHVEHFPQ